MMPVGPGMSSANERCGPRAAPPAPFVNLVAVSARGGAGSGTYGAAAIAGLRLEQLDEGPLSAHLVALPSAARDALEQVLTDPERARALVLAHARSVARLAELGPVVPFRLPSVLADADAARQLLRERRDSLLACLDGLRGCEEWALRVVLIEAAAPAATPPIPTDGSAFLHARLAARDRRRELASGRAAAARLLHDRLVTCCRAALGPDPTPQPAEHGRTLMRAAFLVEQAKRAVFEATAERGAAALAQLGLAVRLVGPMPCYSFVATALGGERVAA
jgi:hypothetical protein